MQGVRPPCSRRIGIFLKLSLNLSFDGGRGIFADQNSTGVHQMKASRRT